MKRNVILLVRLAKEIESELDGIKKWLLEYQQMPQERNTYLLRAKASIFHDFYTAIERIMMKIAEELNGGLPKSEQWHKDLLFDMSLDLEGIRPPFSQKNSMSPSIPICGFVTFSATTMDTSSSPTY